MTVQQTSQQAILNWQQFNVGSAATVNFQQPNASSVALNRVTGSDASQIYGRINANGQVFLINPNGVLFSRDAQVSVGALVASTLNLADSDFLSGNYRFTRNGSNATIANAGTITAAQGGSIALLATDIHNTGTLVAQRGTVVLAAGEAVTLSLSGGPVSVQVDPAQVAVQIQNSNLIEVGDGTVVMTARAANALLGASINNSGVVRATSLTHSGGAIQLSASSGEVTGTAAYVANTGSLEADGLSGGSVRIETGQLDLFGSVSAQGTAGAGGTVGADASRLVMTRDAAINVAGSSDGGSMALTLSNAAGGAAYVSGTLQASGTTGQGGDITLTGHDLNVFGAHLDAHGATAGGRVRVGGGYQGNDSSVANAQNLTVNATAVDVSATQDGQGGSAVFWSEGTTLFGAEVDARGATNGVKGTVNGGLVEVSGRAALGFAGQVQAGQLLLDPSVLNIIEPGMGFEITNFVDPDAAATGFGNTVYDTSNNKLLILSPNESAIGSGAGYVFQRDGTLVSALRDTGVVANWHVMGSDRYLITNTASASGVGAVSYFNAASPFASGRMDSSNSLMGDATYGRGFGQLKDLGGGYWGASISISGSGLDSYTLQKGAWHFFKADSAGSNIATGTLGTANSLVGATTGTAPANTTSNTWYASTTGDALGYFASNDLKNNFNTSDTEPYVSSAFHSIGGGNWVMGSPMWNSNTGAITLVSPTLIDNGSLRGAVSASNSVLGTATGQSLGLALRADGRGGVGLLQFGGAGSTNYLLNLNSYDGKGAFVPLTPGVATTGLFGPLSSSNALLFSTSGDGASAISQLANGSMVLTNPNWSFNRGYARVLPFNTDFLTTLRGTLSTVTASNSLIGVTANGTVSGASMVGTGITELGSGAFLVQSGNVSLGAYTWSNSSTPTVGTLSSSNSLVGSATQNLKSLTTLSNGAYIVKSGNTSGNGGFVYAAAGAGVTGVPGVSGVGMTEGNYTGLYNTSYPTSIADLGGGSWVMTVPGGFGFNNYTAGLIWGGPSVVRSGTPSSTTVLESGYAGQSGNISVFSLGSGAFAASLPRWGGTNTEGAVLRMDATNSAVPTISAANALVGNAGDFLGNGGFTDLGNQRAVLLSPEWSSNTGAATLISAANAASRLVGSASASNSLVGASAGDKLGASDFTNIMSGTPIHNPLIQLGSSDFRALLTPHWGGDKGAVTLFNAVSSDLLGTVGVSNSLVGSKAGDMVGLGAYFMPNPSVAGSYVLDGGASASVFFDLGGGRFALRSANWLAQAGDTSAAGALTWLNPSAGLATGVVDASNSLVGAQAGDRVGKDDNATLFESLGSSNYLLRSTHFNADRGAATVLNAAAAPVGVIGNSNSLVNASNTTGVFNTSNTPTAANAVIAALGTGHVLMTPTWNANAGAITYFAAGATPSGNISASTSLVGAAGNMLGGQVKLLANGKLLIGSPLWNGNLGAATLLVNANGLASTLTGSIAIDGSNSFIGVNSGDRISSSGFADLGNDIFVVYSPEFGSSSNPRTVFGAITLGDSVTNALKGDVSSVNSFFSSTSGQSAATYISGQGLTGAIMSTGNQVGSIQVTQPVDMVGGGLVYADYASRRVNMRPMTITAILNNGTDVTLQATDAINVFSPIVANNPSGSGGNLTLQTNGVSSVVTIGSQGRINTDNGNLLIRSAGDFVNNASASPFTVGTGNWMVYANDPASSRVGNLNFDFKEYGKTFGQTLAGQTARDALSLGLGKAVVFALAPTLVVLAPSDSKTYDATTALSTPYTISGLVGGDTVDVLAVYASQHAGATDINVTIGAGGVKSSAATGSKPIYGYLNQSSVVPGTTTYTGAGQINQFQYQWDLSQSVATKVYDGTDSAPIGWSPAIEKPSFQAAAPEAFTMLPDYANGATVQFQDSSYIATANVVSATQVVMSGSVTATNFSRGGLATDYQFQLNNYNTAPATITPKPLAGGFTASNKVYDGTTAATVSGSLTSSLSGLVSSNYNTASGGLDVVTISGTGTAGASAFSDANAAIGKTVTITVSGLILGGADAANYTVGSATATANITPKALSVAGSTVTSRPYNGSTAATINAGTLSGWVGSETLSATGAGSFASANASNAINVPTTYTLANGGNGGLASNYSLAGETLTGNITPALLALAMDNLTGNISKVYDGTTAATFTTGNFALTGWINSDGTDVTVTQTAGTFADKNVGVSKAVSVTLTNADYAATSTVLSNYGLPTTASATADITAKPITVAATGGNRVYDQGVADGVTLSSSGVVNGDTVNFANTSATFADKNVGTAKTVTVAGISAIAGGDAGNYILNNTSATTTADITAKPITVAATGSNRVYDQGVADAVTLASSGVINGDTVNFFNTGATFADKNVGTAKTVTVAGISVTGSDAGNYSLNNTSATATADITAKSLTASYAGTHRVYDAGTSASVTAASTDIISGDTVTFTQTAAFAAKNVGTGIAVNISSIALGGADAGNYSLINTSTTATADITAKPITVAATGSSRVYDQGVNDGVTLASSGVLSGDTVGFANTGATFADKNVGTGKTVTVAGISATGSDAGNYSLINTSATTTADITAKPITVAATGSSRVYDQGVNDGVTLASSGVISGDTVGFANTSATFADKNVGTAKTVTVTGISVTGSDAGNYSLNNTSATATADISALLATISTVMANNKTEDGATTATLSNPGVLSNRIGNDVVNVVATSAVANFASAVAGTGIVVNVTGLALSGADAANYIFSGAAITMADIHTAQAPTPTPTTTPTPTPAAAQAARRSPARKTRC